MLLKHRLEIESIKSDVLQVLSCLLVYFVHRKLHHVNHLHELHLKWIYLRELALILHSIHSVALAEKTLASCKVLLQVVALVARLFLF